MQMKPGEMSDMDVPNPTKKIPIVNTGAALMSLLISLLVAGEAKAISYTFTKIADTSGSFDFFLNAAINDSGLVAFEASLDTGSNGLFDGIFTGSGGPITTLVDTSGPFNDFFFPPSINNGGTIAFGARLDTGGAGIFTSNGGLITTISDNSGPFENLEGSFISFNDSGIVAFNAFLDTGEQGIFTGNGGPITTIIDNSNNRHDGFFSFPAINNNGTVAFNAFLNFDFGIFASSNGSITTLADRRSFPFSSFGDVALNNSGTVAFQANQLGMAGYDPDRVEGIFISNGGVITTIANNTGFFGDFDNVALNNSGTVVFEACLDGNLICGIFNGSNPVTDKVIDTSDLLFGSMLNQLGFFRQGLNNSGQVAFRATFVDGTQGIFRADPVPETPKPKPIPEPSSVLGLLALGALGAGWRWHQAYKSVS